VQETRLRAVPLFLRVEVLHQFRVLRDSHHVWLPLGSQQLVARLVVEDRPCARAAMATVLWPERSDRDAATQLRRALWRLNRDVPGLIDRESRQLCLSAGVDVDLAEIHRLAEAVATGTQRVSAHAVRLLESDLLSDWADPWLMSHRESLRQVRLHTLEALARNDLEAGRPGSALNAALAAVARDPLRESAHRIVIAAHLAEGNASEALRHYAQFRDLLWRELNLRPSTQLQAMLSENAQVTRFDEHRDALHA
jgi:DNA-binding SARP family transcriptional activator